MRNRKCHSESPHYGSTPEHTRPEGVGRVGTRTLEQNIKHARGRRGARETLEEKRDNRPLPRHLGPRRLVRAASSSPHEVIRWLDGSEQLRAAAPRSEHLPGSESPGEVCIRTNWLERKVCDGWFGAEPATARLPLGCCAVFFKSSNASTTISGRPLHTPRALSNCGGGFSY